MSVRAEGGGRSEGGRHMDFKLTDNSKEVLEATERAIQKGLEAVGIQAEYYAAKLAPVDTGRLRNSITHAVKGDTAYIGTNVEYGAYQEFGTSKMAAQPYLKPAVQNHLNEYKQILENMLKNA